MNDGSRIRFKSLVLAIVTLAIVVIGLPLLGTAQDSTPGASPVGSADPLVQKGEGIYQMVCIACHQPDGKGIPGIYLPLSGNPLVTLEDPTYLVTVLLTGRGGMPRFDTTYDDEEIAAIASYVRQGFGNTAGPVDPGFVASVRASIYQPEVPDVTPTPVGQDPAGISGSPEASPELATPAS